MGRQKGEKVEIQDFEPKLAQAVQNVEKYGPEYGEAKTLSWYLQEQMKTVLATQMGKSAQKSAEAKKMEAYQSAEYLQHLEATKESMGEELRLKAIYTRWCYQFESLRSLLSFTKRQMDLI